MSLAIELVAAAFGVLGTVLLALNGKRAGWGFIAYLVSNAGWILFAWMHAHWGMLAQQVAFTASSLLGAYVWLWKPTAQPVAEPTLDEVRAACNAWYQAGRHVTYTDKMRAALRAAAAQGAKQ